MSKQNQPQSVEGCKNCKERLARSTSKFCDKLCYQDYLLCLKCKKAPNYKEVVGKSQVHRWLDLHYGKPRKCEGESCDGKTEKRWFDWALKKGKEYERKRVNFFRLCRSCHRRYDLSDRLKKKAVKNLWWSKGLKNPGESNKIKKGQILNVYGKNRFK